MLIALLSFSLTTFQPAAFSEKSPFGANYAVVEPLTLQNSCTDVASLDPQNFRFVTREPYGTGRYGDSGELNFKNGLCERQMYGKPEWRTTIESDRIDRVGNDQLRMVVTFSNHLLGSGSMTRLFILKCAAGHLVEVFQAGGEGMRVSRPAHGRIKLSFGVWRPKDAHAMPSAIKVSRYRWEPRVERYILEKSTGFVR